MARRPRVIVPGVPHYVTQTGNNRQPVFLYTEDRRLYLELLARNARRYAARILGYCLMPTHIHVLVVPERPTSLAGLIGRTHTEYALEWNRAEGRSGHLWQSRYRSCPVEPALIEFVLRYIEREPVRAGLVAQAWDHPWSSANHHVFTERSSSVLDVNWECAFGHWDPQHWMNLLMAEEPPLDVDAIRRASLAGRPLGSREFIIRIEAQTGRRLIAMPSGRPRSQAKRVPYLLARP